jgi:sterol desaturase/sphingolipid hydroxylase (fatty acid hydroxylase superfamily)
MRLGRVSYYGDFFVYPAAVVGIVIAVLWMTAPAQWLTWAGAFLIGVGAWTLIEYLLHRYVLHHVPVVKDMHEAHHSDQKALIGTPTWMTVVFFALVFLPLYVVSDATIASGLTAGLMLGYLWYVSVHHIVHHWKAEPGTYAYSLKRRHMLHHHYDDMGNYGVTSGFWDRVLGTDLKGRRESEAKKH